MKSQSNTHTATRYGIGLAGVLLAVLVGVGLALTASAAPIADSPANVTLDDPQNEQIEVSLDFASATDATVELTDGEVIYETTSISGNAGETVATTLGTGSASAGDYQLAIDSPDASNVILNSSAIVKTTTLNVTDAANQSVIVDAVFAGGTDANATVTVTDSTDTTVMTDTIEYIDSQHEDGATLTRSYNASDGLVADDLTVAIATSPASAYDAAYATVESGTGTGGGLIGGEIAGQDTTVAIAAVLVIGGVGYYGRENGWF